MSIEAMNQAIEALERSVATCFDQYSHEQAMSRPDHFINQAITSLRQAIAEAEKQEPVAWGVDWGKAGDTPCVSIIKRKADGGIEVMAVEYAPYTKPQPKREPLTDEAIATVYWGATGQSLRPQDNALAHKFARAIEAAHGIGIKEKNT